MCAIAMLDGIKGAEDVVTIREIKQDYAFSYQTAMFST